MDHPKNVDEFLESVFNPAEDSPEIRDYLQHIAAIPVAKEQEKVLSVEATKEEEAGFWSGLLFFLWYGVNLIVWATIQLLDLADNLITTKELKDQVENRRRRHPIE